MVFLRPPNSSDTVTLNEVPDKAGVEGEVDHFGIRIVDKSRLDRAIDEVVRGDSSSSEASTRRVSRTPTFPLATRVAT